MDTADMFSFTKRNMLLVLFIAFVAINILLVARWLMYGRGIRQAGKNISQKKDVYRAEWDKAKEISIAVPDLADQLSLIPSRNCFSDSEMYTRNATLEKKVVQKLYATISEFLKVYASQDADLIVRFFKDSNEVVIPSRMEVIKGALSEAGVAKEDYTKLNDYELFALYLKKLNRKCHWENLLIESSCIYITEIKSLDELNNSDMTERDGKVWHTSTIFHRFIGPRNVSVEQATKRDGKLSIADLKLVVKHDDTAFNLPAIYYFRFWYDPSESIWHLQNVECLSADLDHPMRISF